jgi:hypothetical protein
MKRYIPIMGAVQCKIQLGDKYQLERTVNINISTDIEEIK